MQNQALYWFIMGKVSPIRVYPEQQDEVYHATEVQRLVEKKKEKKKKIADEIVKKARKK